MFVFFARMYSISNGSRYYFDDDMTTDSIIRFVETILRFVSILWCVCCGVAVANFAHTVQTCTEGSGMGEGGGGWTHCSPCGLPASSRWGGWQRLAGDERCMCQTPCLQWTITPLICNIGSVFKGGQRTDLNWTVPLHHTPWSYRGTGKYLTYSFTLLSPQACPN